MVSCSCSGVLEGNQMVSTLERLKTRVNSTLSYDRKITSELLCTIASTEELGTCPGDSGGPLVHYDQDTDTNVQIGIVFGSLTGNDRSCLIFTIG